MGDDISDYTNEFASEIAHATIHDNDSVMITAFKKHFLEKYLTAPTEDQAIKEARLFHARTGFPKLIFAAVDGTHIKVLQSSISLI